MTRFLFLLLIFTLPLISLFSCKSKEIIVASQPGKEKAGNVNTANQEGKAVDYDQAVAKHNAMQSQRTKEMMARADQRNRKIKSSKNRKWYDQLFNNNCNSSSCMIKTRSRYHTITRSNSCFIKK